MGEAENKVADSELLTLVTTYYNQPEILLKQLDFWGQYQNVKIVVVDDGSKPPIPAIASEYAAVYRIEEDIPWHQDQARNLAMSQAEGWCLLFDLDHLPTATTIKALQKKLPTLDAGKWYRLPRKCKGQPLVTGQNIYLIQNEVFWELGGYPPSRNYGSDRFFLQTLVKSGRYGGVLPVPPLQVVLPAEVRDAATRHLDRTVDPVLLNAPVPFTWSRLA